MGYIFIDIFFTLELSLKDRFWKQGKIIAPRNDNSRSYILLSQSGNQILRNKRFLIADHTKQQMTVFPQYDYGQALTSGATYSNPLTPIVSKTLNPFTPIVSETQNPITPLVSETQNPRNVSHDNSVSGEPRNVSPSPSRANSLPVRDTPILRRSR